MRFRVLGSTEATGEDGPLPVGGPKQRTVLALLIAHAGRPVTTDFLVDQAYRGEPPSGGRRTVQTLVSNLRAELGDAITSVGHGYQLNATRDAIDAFVFEDALESARSQPAPAAAVLIREALALWRGHAFADTEGGEYLDSESRRLGEIRMQALESRIDADLASGFHQDLIAELESLTIEYPLRERFTAQQMVALYRSGRQAEALRAYERTRSYLITEMGLDPSPELRTLEQRILEHDPTLEVDSAPSIRRVAVMVVDIDNPPSLAMLSVAARADLLDQQSEAIHDAIAQNDGELFATSGSTSYVMFSDAASAAMAASTVQRRLDRVETPGHRLRIAIDVGDVETGESVKGPPVNRAAALVSAGNGGQVLLSAGAQQELSGGAGGGWVLRSLGIQKLRGLDAPETVHQLVIDGLPDRFPPLRIEAAPASLPLSARGLAGYELREEVGSGAFGVVHRAYQPSVGREVAIKVIRPEWANRPDFIRRFEVEAQLIARLEHPHIVPLYDYWREPDRAYLVMRWLRGGNLLERLAEGPLSIAETTAVLQQLAPALATAHRNGVVHRDLKPANVLMDREGNAFLTDFGIAEDVTDPRPAPQPIDGGEEYLTPEQLAGDEVTPATDIYALGVLIAACLSGSAQPGSDQVSELPDSAQSVVAAATADSPADRYDTADELLAAWLAAVGTDTAPPAAATYTDARNPYKGLSAFTELDARDFFGRDELVGQLLDSLAAHDLVAAVGPSGIGKSSVVRAGLIPAIRHDALPNSSEWLVTSMVPGAYPFDELASAILRIADKAPTDLEDALQKDDRGLVRALSRYLPDGSTPVLVIDQFEELFTLCDDDAERALFLASIVEAVRDPTSRIRVILTIRADFFDKPLAVAGLGELLQGATVPITSPTRRELVAMVTQPAAQVGVGFESGLAERIADEVVDQPGGLPLLEFALSELFAGRSSDVITSADFDASRGVLASLGRRAEDVYAGLTSREQGVARDVLLRMVSVNEAGRDTRRRVRISELRRLAHDTADVEHVLDAFLSARLITTDRDAVTRGPTIEVAHEALLTQWDRLHQWLDVYRHDLLLQRRLNIATRDWESSGRSNAYLLSPGRLEQFDQLQTSGHVSLTAGELELVAASRAFNENASKTRRRRRTLAVSALAAAAAVSIVLAVLAVLARDDAEVQARSARASELATAAVDQLDEDPELATLLALAAAQNTEDVAFETRRALHAAIDRNRTIASIQRPFDSAWTTIAKMSPDGTQVVVYGDPRAPLSVYEVTDDGSLLEQWTLDARLEPGWAADGAFTSDGRYLVVGVSWPALDLSVSEQPPDPETEGLYLFDAGTGAMIEGPIGPRCGNQNVRGAAVYWFMPFSSVDGFVAGKCDATTEWWVVDIDAWEVVAHEQQGAPVLGVFAASNGKVQVDAFNGFSIYDLATGAAIPAPIDPSVAPYEGPFYFMSPDGTTLYFAYQILDIATGTVIASLEGGPDELAGCGFLPTFSSDSSRLLVGCEDGSVRVFETASGNQVAHLSGHKGWASNGGFNSDASRFATGSADGSVRVWDIGARAEIALISIGQGYHADASLDTAGNTAASIVYRSERISPFDELFSRMTRHAVGEAAVFDIATREVLFRVDGVGGKVARFSPDGRYLALQRAAVDGLGNLQVVNVDSGQPEFELQGLCVVPARGDASACGNLIAADATDIAWSPDGSHIAMAGGSSQRLLVWDVATRDLVFVSDQLGHFPVSATTFSPDGRSVVVSSKSGMWIYDTASWDLVRPVVPHTGRPSWVMTYSSDGTRLFTAQAHSGDVRIYDTTTWEHRLITGGVGQTRDMAISSDERSAALAASDGNIHVIDTATGATIDLISLGNRDITNIEFIDGDRHLLVSGSAGPFEVITLDPIELVEIARSRLARGFTEEECDFYQLRPCPSLEMLRSG